MCQPQRLLLQTNDRCRAVPVVQPTRALPFRCLSSSTQRLRPGKAVKLGLHHVLVIWQALLLTMLDHIAAR